MARVMGYCLILVIFPRLDIWTHQEDRDEKSYKPISESDINHTSNTAQSLIKPRNLCKIGKISTI
jgi:hypothetical protein